MSRTETDAADDRDDLREALREEFGFDRLRHGQEAVIRSVLAGADTLAVMPTGAGKSLCYQLPGLELEGTTVIVSPLISLMKDQVDKLLAMGHAARRLDSTLSAAAEREALEELAAGRVEFVFVTPERLAKEAFQETLASVALDFVVIDEAHCVSRWGHDFRPDYLEIGKALDALGRPPFLALTATAGPEVVDDLREHLRSPDLEVVETGCYRPNLTLAVELVNDDAEKRPRVMEALEEVLEAGGGSAIVYTATIRHAEELAEHLTRHLTRRPSGTSRRPGTDEAWEIPAYHGRLAKDRREEVQDGFMAGAIPVVVATNAFGMGIDKPDIRLVLHYDLPASPDAYYQEAGRAGRDGDPARCLLLYDPADAGTQKALMSSGRRHQDLSDAEAEVKAEEDRERLARLERYAQTALCRWENLVAHFDRDADEPRGWWCGHCDNCESHDEGEALGARRRPAEPEVEALTAEPLDARNGTGAAGVRARVEVGARVTVPIYGEGVLTEVEDAWVEVEFRDGTTRLVRPPARPGGGTDTLEQESPYEAGLATALAAERRIAERLPEMAEAARDAELRKSLRQALGEVRDRIERLAELTDAAQGDDGEAADEGSGDEVVDEILEKILARGRRLSAPSPDLPAGQGGVDDVLLALARRIVEHRAAAYGRLALQARMTGLDGPADELDEIVERLAGAGERLATLVVSRIHPTASQDLGDLTRDELYERAKSLDVPGRSSMRKAELRRAVAERSSSAAM